ncbi:MAG: zinc-ribbon domain-containing protein [Dermatophilaceae bacterium]
MSQLPCPNCGASIGATDAFCSRCGRPSTQGGAPGTPTQSPATAPPPASYPNTPYPSTPYPSPPQPGQAYPGPPQPNLPYQGSAYPAAPSPNGPVPPPAWGAPPAGGGGAAYDPVGAIKEGWAKFSADPGRLLVPVLVGSIVQGIIWTIFYFAVIAALFGAVASSDSTYDTSTRATGIASAVGILFLVVTALLSAATQLIYAGWAKGALGVADGGRPSMNEMYAGWKKGPVLLLCLALGIVGVLSGYVLYVPALIVGALCQFAIFDMIDKGTGVVDSVKRSSRMVIANPGPILLFDLLAGIVLVLGALPCGLGLLVAIPVTIVGHARTYRAFAPAVTR